MSSNKRNGWSNHPFKRQSSGLLCETHWLFPHPCTPIDLACEVLKSSQRINFLLWYGEEKQTQTQFATKLQSKKGTKNLWISISQIHRLFDYANHNYLNENIQNKMTIKINNIETKGVKNNRNCILNQTDTRHRTICINFLKSFTS